MEYELYHHGVKNMRWGIRRYQRKDGSLTALGKRRYAKQQEAEAKKAEEEAKKVEDYAERKQKAIKSGSAKDVLEFQGDLTKQEMQSAIERIRWEQDMKSLSAKELDTGKSKTEKFFSNVDKATSYAGSAAKAWNTFANIYNAFSGTNSISLPKIDTGIDKGNKNERKAEKREKAKAEEARQKREEQEEQRESKRQERAKNRNDRSKSSDSSSSTDRTVYEGEVVGGGSSHKTSTGSSKSSSKTVIDADFVDLGVSSVSPETRAIGQSFVAGLLEEPKR